MNNALRRKKTAVMLAIAAAMLAVLMFAISAMAEEDADDDSTASTEAVTSTAAADTLEIGDNDNAESPVIPEGTDNAESPVIPEGTDNAESPVIPERTDDTESPVIPEGTDNSESPVIPERTDNTESPVIPVENAIMMLAEGEPEEGVVAQADDGQIETASYTGPRYVIYNGTMPLNVGDAYADSSDFLKNIPDFKDLKSILLNARQGDAQFYDIMENKWQVWYVKNDTERLTIGDINMDEATACMRINKYDFNTPPYDVDKGPLILVPTWSAKEYQIPITSGSQSGTTLTFTAENYNTIQLPAAEEGYCWTFKYKDKEYDLNVSEASKIWTNEINGIRISGRDFNAANAELKLTELQSGNADFEQGGWRVGETKPAPKTLASATNGIDNVTYFYKARGAENSTYTTTPPTASGEYTAKAVFAAKGRYKAVEVTSDFEISAADQPGSSEDEPWVRDGIISNGIKNLKTTVMYKLGDGRWTVDGDTTEYTGGVSFYVNIAGDYNFTKK